MESSSQALGTEMDAKPKGRKRLADDELLRRLQELRAFVLRDIDFIRERSDRPGGLRAWLDKERNQDTCDHIPHYNWLYSMEQRIRESRATGDSTLADSIDAIEAMVLQRDTGPDPNTSDEADVPSHAKKAKSSLVKPQTDTFEEAQPHGDTHIPLSAWPHATSSGEAAAMPTGDSIQSPEMPKVQLFAYAGAVCQAEEAALLAHPACKRLRPIYEHIRDMRTKLSPAS